MKVDPRLVRQWSKAVRVLEPESVIKQRIAVNKAVNGDGGINPLSIPMGGGLMFFTFFEDSNTNNASNTNWVSHINGDIELSEGVWSLTILNWARGDNSLSDNMNLKHQINGVDGDNILNRLVINTAAASPLFLMNSFTGISGGETVKVQNLFKSQSTGSSNLRNDMMLVIAVRG